ncbi:MAG: Uncharacterized protein CEN90_767 [Parcubacteria group bacterium Licking1014_17]|nr:MAG: Uncharacterized protein CEN90_767 [Parcubacteria group bacterium Licking1014_17]
MPEIIDLDGEEQQKGDDRFKRGGFTPRIYSWQGPKYRKPHFKRVLIFAGIVAAIGLVYLLWARDWVTALLFFLISVTAVYHARREPPIVTYKIDPVGITLGDTIHPHSEIKSFWIGYQPLYNIKELSLYLNKRFRPYTVIPLEDQDPVNLRQMLLPYIAEEKHEENFGDNILRVFGL